MRCSSASGGCHLEAERDRRRGWSRSPRGISSRCRRSITANRCIPFRRPEDRDRGGEPVRVGALRRHRRRDRPFGASAPGPVVFEEFGITAEALVNGQRHFSTRWTTSMTFSSARSRPRNRREVLRVRGGRDDETPRALRPTGTEPLARQPETRLHHGRHTKGLMVDKGIRGITSNPTIFAKAIESEDDYDEQFESLLPDHTSRSPTGSS